ncbi:MAG: Mercuric resistance operon regulatory protein [bacterium]|nr:Mercuric resistance operon regulatory protein [bacterium]
MGIREQHTIKLLEKPLRVGELAKRTGKTVRALHLYEELGLLKPVHRSKGGFRLYAPSTVKRVEWIQKLQDAGFSLHDLQDLLHGVSEQSGVASVAMERVRQVFAERLRETRDQIGRLTQLERDLDASLAYLEGCRSCEPKAHQIQECPSCNHNGHEEGAQPLLVAGIHRG